MLHLSPRRVGFVDAFELDTARGFIGRDFVEPLDGFAGVGVDALSAVLEAVELGKGLLCVSQGDREAAMLWPTVQRDIKTYSVLGDPLADAIAGALLDAGDQSGIVDDAVEYLALRWLGGARGGLGLARPRGAGTATHDYRRCASQPRVVRV